MAIKSEKKDGEMRWHFPILDNGESDGLSDPLLQYFEGDYERYIAREVIQNSIDACADPSLPVKVSFEKIKMAAEEVPGIEELRKRIKLCLDLARTKKKEKAEKHFEEAHKVVSANQIEVLRISDFNTTGLTGGDKDDSGKWHRLVKAIGENELTGAGGGSFGIGKGAPFAASAIRTVYYSTINNEGEPIFQGKTRLISHEWEGEERKGVGFYGVNGYQSVRNLRDVPKKFCRTHQGTDIFIIGYKASENWMEIIARSVLANFWAAIHFGTLEVSVGSGKEIISMQGGNLYEMLEKFSRDEALPYYRSLIAPTSKTDKSLPLVGNCSLFIRVEEGFPKDIALMRKPKMIVDKKGYRILQDAYAGVFICEDDEGNKLLRGMEPPEHDKWDENRDKVLGKKVWKEINSWVKSVLRDMSSGESGDPEDIPDLDKFLPYDDESETDVERGGRTKESGSAEENESGLEIGAVREDTPGEIEGYISRPMASKGGSGSSISRGKHDTVGGGGYETYDGGTDQGKNFSRVDTSALRFRSIVAGTKDGKTEYCLVITPEADMEGAINIVAVGDDASYPVSLSYAQKWDAADKYAVSGSYINSLKLKKDEPLKIRIGLKSRARYALGIEKYES